jgi:hypothetical protein
MCRNVNCDTFAAQHVADWPFDRKDGLTGVDSIPSIGAVSHGHIEVFEDSRGSVQAGSHTTLCRNEVSGCFAG